MSKSQCIGGMLLACLLGCGQSASAAPSERSSPAVIEWQQIAAGVSTGEYRLGDRDSVFSAPVILVRIQPQAARFHVIEAPPGGADVQLMTRSIGGVVGINANFFDELHRPLGLVVSGGKQRHGLQRGGSTLTGVFLVRNDRPLIVHRDEYDPEGVSVAVQAGPRLIADGHAVAIKSGQDSSRRSGVAITRDGAVILFATVLRFPGASMEELISMLLDPQLKVKDALNFDGGGSSQLFIEKFAQRSEEVFVNGGDSVPVGLVVKVK